jgi:hypothetical protein
MARYEKAMRRIRPLALTFSGAYGHLSTVDVLKAHG